MSIIAKAKQVAEQTSSYMITGKSGNGKSTLAIQTVLERKADKVLYVAFANAPVHLIPENWDVAIVCSADDIKKLIADVRKEGAYDAIILDDFDTAVSYYLPTDAAPTLQQYGGMTPKVTNAFLSLRSATSTIVVVVSAVDRTDVNTGKTERQLYLTPDVQNRIVKHLTHAWYVGLRRNKSKDEDYYTYVVQRNKALALDFIGAGAEPWEDYLSKNLDLTAE